LKQKKRPVLDITFSAWVLRWRPRYVAPRPSPEYECGKRNPLYPIRANSFCFNNNVSNLYNNSVVAKIYGMAYIFTLLMFRKPNKTTINKIKTTHLYRLTSFRFSFIFRYFKIFQVSQIWSVWFVITCGSVR
jgi:hypothetical protein